MAFDPISRRIILFGGIALGGSTWLADTWAFDGVQWQQLPTFTVPTRRSSHAMTLDRRRGRIVMFGGESPTMLNDTWEWMGGDWRPVLTPMCPPVRYGHVLGWDAVHERVILFGGESVPPHTDTWAYDGITWTRLQPTSSPVTGLGFSVASDPFRRRVVIHGGRIGSVPSNPRYLVETWEWDGDTWLLRAPSVSPPPRTGHPTAFDEARSRVLLYGGIYVDASGYRRLDDSWEYDGTTWRELATAYRPLAFENMSMAYHAESERTLLVPGPMAASFEACSVWPAICASYGAGCAGSNGVPGLAAAPGSRPWLADTMRVTVSNAPQTATPVLLLTGVSNSRLATGAGEVPLPLELGLFGMPGCWLQASAELVLPGVANHGCASFEFPIAQRQMVGLSIYQQVLLLDAAANIGGLTTTNAVVQRIGMR